MKSVPILIFLLLSAPAWPESIMKCQDADGKWHYGDHAATECADSSRVTEINQRGVKLKEIKAPPTQEELEAKQRMEEKLAKQELQEAEQAELDRRLLNTYESEENIIRSRDSLLDAIDQTIAADQELKQRLEEELAALQQDSDQQDFEQKAAALRSQIQDFEEAIRDRLATRELARMRYDAELARFRELVTQ